MAHAWAVAEGGCYSNLTALTAAASLAMLDEKEENMGAGTRHRKAFLAANTVCIFCGGGKPSTSIEHCPPRAMFQNRSWPEGFEFASCHECNGGLSDHDAIIAVLGRIDPLNGKVDGDGQLLGLVKNLNRQYPGMLDQMFANEKPIEQVMPDGSRCQMVAVNIPDELHEAMWTLAGKLTKAVFHMETGGVRERIGQGGPLEWAW